MTVNRTLLHAQTATSNGSTGGAAGAGAGTGTLIPTSGRNGTTHGMRGFASYSGDESPPPDYNVVVHDNNRHGLFFLFFYPKFTPTSNDLILYTLGKRILIHNWMIFQ